jgi:hypothetical protein
MTEAQWLESDDPAAMLTFLAGRVSRRQLLLFACACARGWDHPMAARGVELGEGLADGKIDERAWRASFPPLPSYLLPQLPFNVGPALFQQFITPHHIAGLAAYIGFVRGEVRAGARQADFLRDVVGNPFRRPGLPEAVRRFDGGIVARLAEPIYDEQDYARLPVLGDALEEAGADLALVEHCHAEGPHVRGCWVIDLVLGKA